MKLGARLVIAAALGGFLIQPAYAADIAIEGVTPAREYGAECLVAHVSLRGRISEGDTRKLADAIGEVDKYVADKKAHCYVNDGDADRLVYLDLQSNGGSYTEGWKLAKFISDRKTIAATYVSKDSYCYSACAIAFLGGSVPAAEGSILLRRVIHPTAKLGFHAPFPVLENDSYSAGTVQSYFLAAFTVASSFMKEAKSLGITPEVAQLLLQPTPDQFYEITTSGRAMLTNIEVSAAPYDFSVFGDALKTITPQNVLNLCYNNQVLKDSGDSTSIIDFLERRKNSKFAPFTALKTKTGYFGPDFPVDVLIVPVADLAEGEVLSCVAMVASNVNAPEPSERGYKFACLGFDYGERELADKIRTNGLDWLSQSDGNRCSDASKLALLPWNTKLSDIPEEFQGD